jgi:hypothetical protein
MVLGVVAVILCLVVPAASSGRAHAGREGMTYAKIARYRRENGLDLDLAGRPKAIAARIDGLLAAWRDGEHWARSTASVWGAPLRKADLKLMSFRQKVLRRWNEQFEPWLARHPEADATYAGYFADPEKGGWIYIGFTAEQESLVARMKRELHLIGPGLLRPFPYQPAHTEVELGALMESLSEEESLWKVMNSIGLEAKINKVTVTTTKVARLRAILAERYGPDAPIQVEFGEPAVPL